MQCAESLRVQAYFDNELDALSAAEIERHSAHCAECRTLLQDLQKVRGAMRKDLAYRQAPPELRDRVMLALDEEEAASSPSEHQQPERRQPARKRPASCRPRP